MIHNGLKQIISLVKRRYDFLKDRKSGRKRHNNESYPEKVTKKGITRKDI